MPRILEKNQQHYRRALQRLPLGVASNFRFWGEGRTIYVKQGRGARLTDIDGNVYVDYRMGYGPSILGYADPRVDAAARELAMSLAQGPSIALGYIKRNINNAEHMSLEACFDGEAIHHSRAGETADHKEAAKAFVEKRKPVFEGR